MTAETMVYGWLLICLVIILLVPAFIVIYMLIRGAYERRKERRKPFVDKFGRLFKNRKQYDQRLQELSRENWKDVTG